MEAAEPILRRAGCEGDARGVPETRGKQDLDRRAAIAKPEPPALDTRLRQAIIAAQRLSDDLDSMGVAALFLNHAREIERFTPSASELFGLGDKDVGRPIGDLAGGVDDPALIDDIAKAQETLAPVRAQVRMWDGTWYERRVLARRRQEGGIDGMAITYWEVSEIGAVLRKTLMAKHFAENIVNTVRDPLVVLDGDFKLVGVNRSFHQLFDTDDDAIVGRSLFALADGQWDIAELRRHLGRVLSEGVPLEAFSLTIEVAGKGERDLVLNARMPADGDGASAVILLALEDVTEKKQAQQSQRDREARLHAIMEAVPEAIITIDCKGIVTSYSPPSATILGHAPSEVIGRNVSMLMPEPHRRLHDDYIAAYLSTGEARIIGVGRDLEARHKSGKTVPIHLKVSEVVIGGERQFLGVIRDLSEERESRKQLEQAQKMEVVGQLAGGIAHDFNNLLTVVIGNIELLEMRPDDPAREEILGEALEAANLGAALVSKLLLLSKRRRLTPERLDLRHVVEGLEPILRRTLGEQIVIRADLEDDLDQVLADPGQIESAVLNLAINARDAMPRGGTLTIRALNAKVDAGRRADDHADLAPGDYVVLSVRDTGTGMTPEVLSRAFEPFFTTKGAAEGTGLGLPMIYGWARQSGGALTLRSNPGEGAEVRLYLPALEAEGDALPDGAGAANRPTGAAKRETVLLVEDDPRVRNLTRQRLEYLGYPVVEAADGREALAHLEKRRDIGLMLSDIVMPGGIDGMELAKRASAGQPGLAIVLTTGFARATDAATWPVLRKPYNIETLSKTLRAALEGSA